MFHRYRTDHPNQVHQLLVSVSKHFYVRRNGTIAFQWKAIDIDLARLDTAKRNHIVHYLLRDHYSGAFYAEAATTEDLIADSDESGRGFRHEAGPAFRFESGPRFRRDAGHRVTLS